MTEMMIDKLALRAERKARFKVGVIYADKMSDMLWHIYGDTVPKKGALGRAGATWDYAEGVWRYVGAELPPAIQRMIATPEIKPVVVNPVEATLPTDQREVLARLRAASAQMTPAPVIDRVTPPVDPTPKPVTAIIVYDPIILKPLFPLPTPTLPMHEEGQREGLQQRARHCCHRRNKEVARLTDGIDQLVLALERLANEGKAPVQLRRLARIADSIGSEGMTFKEAVEMEDLPDGYRGSAHVWR